MDESFTLRNKLLQRGKRMFKRDSNVPHHSGFQKALQIEEPKSQM